MDKQWYKSLTIWGAVLLGVGYGLEVYGVTGALEIAEKIAIVLGFPVTLIGARIAIGKLISKK